MKTNLIFGCIADDFTGGSDAASFLAAGGMQTILCSGIPDENFVLPEECEAVVIALKSRTQETVSAVSDSLKAIQWLEEQGAEHFYVKYCSTFDSTPKGNIGPILDAVLEKLKVSGSIICPALPANDRTVKDGILYVKGMPLAESSMKDHPLTPMWESRIAKLMEPQSSYESLELHKDVLYGERDKLNAVISSFAAGKEHYYLIPDYTEDADAELIAELFGDDKVLSGGSGILASLARRLKKTEVHNSIEDGTYGEAIILAGSCSLATKAQTDFYLNHEGKAIRLEDHLLLSKIQNPEMLWKQVKDLGWSAPLIYAWESAEGLQSKRDEKGKELSALIEKTLSLTAKYAVDGGVKRIIAAGGETSGAVAQALGYQSFWIGSSIAPGVPILIPVEQPDVRLVLKSGNFGQEDFFLKALDMTKEQKNE